MNSFRLFFVTVAIANFTYLFLSIFTHFALTFILFFRFKICLISYWDCDWLMTFNLFNLLKWLCFDLKIVIDAFLNLLIFFTNRLLIYLFVKELCSLFCPKIAFFMLRIYRWLVSWNFSCDTHSVLFIIDCLIFILCVKKGNKYGCKNRFWSFLLKFYHFD